MEGHDRGQKCERGHQKGGGRMFLAALFGASSWMEIITEAKSARGLNDIGGDGVRGNWFFMEEAPKMFSTGGPPTPQPPPVSTKRARIVYLKSTELPRIVS